MTKLLPPIAAVAAAFSLCIASEMAWAGNNFDPFDYSGPSRLSNQAPAAQPAQSSSTSDTKATNSASPVAFHSADRQYEVAVAQSSAPSPFEPAHRTVSDRAGELVMHALALVGVTYRHGGSTAETGLDCSGLVRLVFHDSLGIELPHRAEEISHYGEKVGKDELQPGDLVFYNTLKRGFSHVGIYLGDGRFVHAPSTGGEVRVENMNMPYWTKRFNGARRLADDDSK